MPASCIGPFRSPEIGSILGAFLALAASVDPGSHFLLHAQSR
jgi:hypothetical protein